MQTILKEAGSDLEYILKVNIYLSNLPRDFADMNEEGKIMFIQQPPGMYNAVFGGLMTTRTKHLGAAGVVIDGRFRDIDEIQELKLPV